MSSAVPSKRSAPGNFEEQLAEAKKRAAEVKARLEAAAAASSKNGTSPPVSADSAPRSAAEIARERVEALKAKVAAAKARVKSDAPPERPSAQTNQYQYQTTKQNQSESTNDTARFGTGLAVGIHPALLSDVQVSKSSTKSKSKSKRDEVQKANPYLSEHAPTARPKRELKFTHTQDLRPAMQAANEARRKAALEAMKKRIQATAAKAGLEENIEVQVFAVPMPPDVEFWDEDFQETIENNAGITNLVCHPAMMEPPQDKYVTLKAPTLMLTKKEQKKMRRMRRAQEHKDEQDKIRLGLIPAPEPKLKHSNVMRVYGELAVKDPTAVEAMVNQQINARKAKHDTANAERKLTKEQRAEKIKTSAESNAAMGLTQSVFKIALGKDKLIGKLRYKIDMNAKQYHDLTGCCISAPTLTVVIVEAGEYTTRKMKRLFEHRIKWQAILDGDGEIQNQDDDDEEEDDTKDTTCMLIWQGEIRSRKFKRWGGVRNAETDTFAKEALARFKMENFWNLAKNVT